jgi:hypothetical protein
MVLVVQSGNKSATLYSTLLDLSQAEELVLALNKDLAFELWMFHDLQLSKENREQLESLLNRFAWQCLHETGLQFSRTELEKYPAKLNLVSKIEQTCTDFYPSIASSWTLGIYFKPDAGIQAGKAGKDKAVPQALCEIGQLSHLTDAPQCNITYNKYKANSPVEQQNSIERLHKIVLGL